MLLNRHFTWLGLLLVLSMMPILGTKEYFNIRDLKSMQILPCSIRKTGDECAKKETLARFNNKQALAY